MEFHSVLEERWSCRAFTAQEVPEATLRQVFALAQRTASWCNTQPWQVHLVSGEARERLAKGLVESVVSGSGGSDLPMPGGYVGVYQERRREAGYALYESLGIAREDREARDLQMLKNFSFFDAPHVAIITTDATRVSTGPSTAVATSPTCSTPPMSWGLRRSRRRPSPCSHRPCARCSTCPRTAWSCARSRSLRRRRSPGQCLPDQPRHGRGLGRLRLLSPTSPTQSDHSDQSVAGAAYDPLATRRPEFVGPARN